MKTINPTPVSKALEEVWDMKEKASEATKDLSLEDLKKHYKEVANKTAKLLNAKIVPNEDGSFRFDY
jgi:hypothetical protein